MKVKEKLDEETSRIQNLKQQMTTNKEQIILDQKKEWDELVKRREQEEAQKIAAFNAQKIKDEQMRQKNELIDQLNRQRQIRARDVLQELLSKGIKQVGKKQIVELQDQEEVDYDVIMNFYQKVVRSEKEKVEEKKNQKVNNVEIWARALREEESKAMKDYCDKNGQQEMENIKKAIMEKHAKELQTKKALESAKGPFAKYK